MVISEMIAALERVKHTYGDCKVVVGERNGVLVDRIDVGAEPKDEGEGYLVIIQAYIVKR